MLVYFGALTKILGGLGPLGSASVGESALYCLTNLLVRVSFAILQGYILRVLTTGDPDEMRFRNKLDALNYMSKAHCWAPTWHHTGPRLGACDAHTA